MNTFAIAPVAIHPGLFLAELLGELNISQAQLARATHISAMRISHIVRAERPVTADIALRFGQVFSQSPQYWLNLQDNYDLTLAHQAFSEELKTMQAFG
jgi:antitoxin HigA-1